MSVAAHALEDQALVPGAHFGPDPETDRQSTVAEPVRVVVADDEPVVRRALNRMLTRLGCEVMEAGSGSEALRLCRSRAVDVLISDVVMPGMGGIELCRLLRADPQLRLLPIVLVTGDNSREKKIEGLRAGATDFLAKPFDAAELEVRVLNLARSNRLLSDLDSAEEVVFSIARTVEARDSGTGDHCDRLAHLGVEFGSYLGLCEADLVSLRRGGYLHDIGKIGVPDAVLLKAGRLTPEEWKVMHRHVEIGHSICAPMRTLRSVLPIIRHHHERWDGGGYPDGLSGRDIPFLARLFQVIDVFDALTSDRCYRPALSVCEALATLDQETALGWRDPELVAEFRLFMREKRGVGGGR